MYESITAENVMMYAIRHYNNPQCEGEKEFQDDLKRFKYIKRLLRKYHETGILKERLLLNHFIVLNNVFGADACATATPALVEPVKCIISISLCSDIAAPTTGPIPFTKLKTPAGTPAA